MMTGGCRCGVVRYELEGEAAHHALCHCRNCQMAHAAPMVGWIAFKAEQVRFAGAEPVRYTGPSGSIQGAPTSSNGRVVPRPSESSVASIKHIPG